MKKILFIFAVVSIFLTSCSNDAEVKQKLTGEWVLMEQNSQTNEPVHYIFQDNGHYQRYWSDPNVDQQEGIWSIKNSKLDIYVMGVPMSLKYLISGDILTLKGVKYKKVE